MVRHARTCGGPVDVIGTEVGLLHRLHKETPGHTFVPLREDAICEYMKAITLPKLYRALRDDVYEVRVEASIAARARQAIDRLLAVASQLADFSSPRSGQQTLRRRRGPVRHRGEEPTRSVSP